MKQIIHVYNEKVYYTPYYGDCMSMENDCPILSTEVEVDEIPTFEETPLYDNELYYNGEFYVKLVLNVNKCYAEINEQKALLDDTDYRVLKMWEAQVLGLPAPYLNPELFQFRQTARDEITRIENLIKENNG